MKKYQSKRALRQSMLSALTMGVFILLALGSLDDKELWDDLLGLDVIVKKWNVIGGGYAVEEYHESNKTFRTFTGEKDSDGKWNGPVKIEIRHAYSDKVSCTEEVTYDHGTRKGNSKITYSSRVINTIYYNGVCYRNIPDEKVAYRNRETTSAYQVLTDKYPYFSFTLNAFEYEDAYIEAYMDTLEAVLNTYEFDATDFDSYYEDVLDILGETPWDSLLVLQSNLFILQGLEEMKNAEIRLAVIDRYRSEASSTFEVVNSTYPRYLQMLNDSGVTNPDFEQFCQDLDDTLASYGYLDPEDENFTDSLDDRLFWALFAIMKLDELFTSPAKLPMNKVPLTSGNYFTNRIMSKVNTGLGLRSVKSSSAEVSGVVVSGMLLYFLRADIIRKAVREAYMINKGIVRLPILATEFLENNSASSVTLKGYVMEDGGASVTSRGIAWASVYGPTTNDNTEASGTGTGNFTVNLTGLTKGTTYYARTYATNNVGTAYGNCIEFVATTPTGIQDVNPFINDFRIYPNPAKESTTCSFRLGSPAMVTLKIIDMKGQVVLYHDPCMMPLGENQIKLDLSGLQNGLYNCQLVNGSKLFVRKLEIVR
jgi:hypothetical protein